MRVAAFRDVCANVRDMTVHFHACVNATERNLWAARARIVLREGMDAECPRASQDDKQRMGAALFELLQMIRQVETATATLGVPTSGLKTRTTRANAYNKSASRAVRLSRAARSAMRRGYF